MLETIFISATSLFRARAIRCVSILAVVLGAAATESPVAAAETFHIEEATIADIQKAILAKRVTATQIVNLYLERIKAYNGPCVDEPYGILGPVTTIPHAKGINALS